MEVRFAADIEAELTKLATDTGKAPAQLVEETMARVFSDRARFLAGVQRGGEAAARGEFMEHEEVVERIERIISGS
jgi:predicted transcriptional regulator